MKSIFRKEKNEVSERERERERERDLTCKKPTWNSNKHAILVIKRKSLRLIQTLMLWFRNPNYEATISKRYKPIFRRLLIPEYYCAS